MNLDLTIQQLRQATTPAEIIAAIEQLASFNHPDTIPVLLETFNHHHPAVRGAGAQALVKLAPESVEPLISAYYHSTNQNVQAYVVQALAQIADERATELLIEMVGVSVANHCQGNVRRVAARGLGKIAGQTSHLEIVAQVIEKLTWALQNPEDWGLRYAAAVSLQEIGTPTAIAVLDLALTQEKDMVVQARIKNAQQALAKA
jgi:bilin biosynthesis PecF protein